jgi:hypothetical protein
MSAPQPEVPAPQQASPALTLGAARELGLTRNNLRTRRWAHPYRGVYVPTQDADDLLTRCAALALVLPPQARFSHGTAAGLYGSPLAATAEVHVSVPAGVSVPRSRTGVVVHQRTLDREPLLVHGLALTRPEQTFLDLAVVLPLADLLVLGDHLVNRWTTQAQLVAYLQARPGTRGVVRARETAALVRAGAGSPQESRLRLIIVRAGLPEPAVNVPVFDEVGGWIGSPDLGYGAYRIALQYEGDVHRSNPRRWRQDIARDEAFADAGWLVLRVTADDVARPSRLLHRLTRALVARGWRPLPTTTPR